MRISEIRIKKRKKPLHKKKSKSKKSPLTIFQKILKVIRSFTVKDWEIGIDTGDYTRNAQLYPVNFIPNLYKHLKINFQDENYLFLKIQNRPWRIVKAFYSKQ